MNYYIVMDVKGNFCRGVFSTKRKALVCVEHASRDGSNCLVFEYEVNKEYYRESAEQVTGT